MRLLSPYRKLRNRTIGEGRSGKVWAENARTDIESLAATLPIVVARHQNNVRNGTRTSSGSAIRSVAAFGYLVGPGSKSPLEFRRSPGNMRRYSEDEIAAMKARIEGLLDIARHAVNGTRPRYRPFRSWWSGVNKEAAFKNVHLAEALMALFYTDAEIRAELPDATRRAMSTLSSDDPTRLLAIKALASQDRDRPPCSPEQLCSIISIGHQAADRQHTKLRTFRNVLLTGFVITLILLASFLFFGYVKPDYLPLCFTQDPSPLPPKNAVACPTGESTVLHPRKPTSWDALTVAVLGLVGGALSAAVFIRGMSTNSTPYNVAVPLALLKVPTGAMAAVIGMLLVAGDFVPGFSAIDKQGQILAYSLLFGFSQQLFTQLLDRRAKDLVANIPSKAKESSIEGVWRNPA